MTDLLDNYDSMTADQIRKHKWTDPELDELVAKKVMGCEYMDIDDAGPFYWAAEDERAFPIKLWHPSTDMNDAMLALDTFGDWFLDRTKGGYVAIVDISVIDMTAESKCTRAICIATLIAEKERLAAPPGPLAV